MKKIFTLIALAVSSLSMMAKDYTGHLVIDVNGVPVEKDANINIEKSGDSYTLTLKNFDITLAGETMAVGTIQLDNVKYTTVDGLTTLSYNDNTTIKDGDDGREYMMVDQEVPIDMTGRLTDNIFATSIDINLGIMTVSVDFTTEGFQIPNSGFEDFHTATLTYEKKTYTSDEPNAWHSFMSASGNETYIALAGSSPHTFISNQVRPGSTGKQSVKLLALNAIIAIANGTITTGRMNTGSSKATDVDNNYAWMDMSKTNVDANNDPFYAKMNGMPDSLEVWMIFGQGDPNKAKDHPYATVTAIITDGTEFHEPAPTGVTYTNIVGEARNAKIESTNGEWKKITIPFNYDDFKANNATPRAILATISTNADAGMGSVNDSILVDDVRLIYNAGVKSMSVKGNDVTLIEGQTEYNTTATGDINADDINVVSDGQGAFITKQLESVDGGVKATITVISNDLKTTNTYTINITGGTTGVKKVETVKNQTVSAIYNANGQRVSDMNQSGLYIIKNADGKTVKFLKK